MSRITHGGLGWALEMGAHVLPRAAKNRLPPWLRAPSPPRRPWGQGQGLSPQLTRHTCVGQPAPSLRRPAVSKQKESGLLCGLHCWTPSPCSGLRPQLLQDRTQGSSGPAHPTHPAPSALSPHPASSASGHLAQPWVVSSLLSLCPLLQLDCEQSPQLSVFP